MGQIKQTWSNWKLCLITENQFSFLIHKEMREKRGGTKTTGNISIYLVTEKEEESKRKQNFDPYIFLLFLFPNTEKTPLIHSFELLFVSLNKKQKTKNKTKQKEKEN